MRAVIQIVDKATLTVDDKVVGDIDKGLAIYLGVHFSDTIEKAEKLATKIANLRIFKDSEDKINLCVKQAGNSALVVSNFTLYADASRGHRPNFSYAMEPNKAKEIYEHFVNVLKQEGLKVETGIFGAHMIINQINRGPINIFLEM